MTRRPLQEVDELFRKQSERRIESTGRVDETGREGAAAAGARAAVASTLGGGGSLGGVNRLRGRLGRGALGLDELRTGFGRGSTTSGNGR